VLYNLKPFINIIAKSCIVTLLLLLQAISTTAQTLDLNKIDNAINENITTTGSAHLILFRSNAEILNKSYTNTPQKITATTRIKISTASIWLASATILSIVDEGYITLDTEISKVLPQFKGDKGKVTIRQLLSHTSGFPTNSIYLKDRNLSLEQSVDSIAKHLSLTNPSGKSFSYGGVSIQIAARIAEVVSKKSWEQLFYEQIAKPCAMSVSDFGKAKSIMIGDGAYSSANDYHNFLKMILNKGMYNGKRVLSEKMINEMLTDHTGGLPLGYTPYRFRTSQNSRFYGLGVWIERIDPKTKIGTEINSQGARGFTPWINTCKNIGGVFAVYGDLKSAQSTVDGIKILLEDNYIDKCNDIATENIENLETISGRIKESSSVASSNTMLITFQLDKNSFVNLKFFDSLGNEITQILNKQMNAGEHTIPLNTSELPSGVYFYRLKVNERLETKKVTIKK
jgi:CubicO group peptidase (beta-lactamase class C family)